MSRRRGGGPGVPPGRRPVPWRARLGVRIGLVLAAALVLLQLALVPFRTWAEELLGDNVWTRYGLPAAVSTAVAVGIAVALAAWLGGRLARLSDARRASDDPETLPGPYDESGNDEIARAAATMNALRSRVASREKALGLRDIRRREWIAQVSHDLRTPLTAQLACLDRAQMILDKPDLSVTAMKLNELRELLSVAKADAGRVHTLADDLLEIARLEAGDQLRLEPVPPGELARQAARRMEPLAAQKGMRLDLKLTAGLPMLNADGRRLTRAVENLLRNAIQHGRSRIEVRVVLSENTIRFEVRDDGRGLPSQPDFLDYLRRKSSDIRLSELAKRRKNADSAGLGLVVAQRVAEAHHGTVDAYNLSTGGAAFWLGIPVPADDPALADRTAATAPDGSAGRRRST